MRHSAPLLPPVAHCSFVRSSEDCRSFAIARGFAGATRLHSAIAYCQAIHAKGASVYGEMQTPNRQIMLFYDARGLLDDSARWSLLCRHVRVVNASRERSIARTTYRSC